MDELDRKKDSESINGDHTKWNMSDFHTVYI